MAETRYIFVGPPASGKGTQTKLISETKGLVHVDTGSLLRENIANKTKSGLIAKDYIDKGHLVPAKIVAEIIKDRITQQDCAKGFILDGYPRSIEQAKKLEEIRQKYLPQIQFKVIYFDIPMDNLLERIIHRYSCPKCGAIYNMKLNPSSKGNKCEKCDVELTQRKDDTKEVAKARFETYNEETAPLINYYKKQNALVKIDASRTVHEIYQDIVRIMKNDNN